MKALAWMTIVPILASMAAAETLGEAARREQERRDKKKKEAAAAPVIGDQELVARRGKESKGTFSPAMGSGSVAPQPEIGRGPSSSKASDSGSPGELDARRAAARERLDASYETIARTAVSFLRALQQYAPCRKAVTPPSRSCTALLIRTGELAQSVGDSMVEAEDAARQGWLAPGEVRDARQRHGMDDSYWDQLVRTVRRYRP